MGSESEIVAGEFQVNGAGGRATRGDVVGVRSGEMGEIQTGGLEGLGRARLPTTATERR